MGICASKPTNKEEVERHSDRALTPGATATITSSLQGAKSGQQDILQQASGELPIAKDSYGAEEVQKPRSARTSLDARRQAAEPTEGSLSPEDDTGASSSDVDDPQLMKEYIRLAEMLRYSPYPVSLIAIEEDNQPYVFVNNVSSHCMQCIRLFYNVPFCYNGSFAPKHFSQYHYLLCAGVLRTARLHRHRCDWQVMVCSLVSTYLLGLMLSSTYSHQPLPLIIL